MSLTSNELKKIQNMINDENMPINTRITEITNLYKKIKPANAENIKKETLLEAINTVIKSDITPSTILEEIYEYLQKEKQLETIQNANFPSKKIMEILNEYEELYQGFRDIFSRFDYQRNNLNEKMIYTETLEKNNKNPLKSIVNNLTFFIDSKKIDSINLEEQEYIEKIKKVKEDFTDYFSAILKNNNIHFSVLSVAINTYSKYTSLSEEHLKTILNHPSSESSIINEALSVSPKYINAETIDILKKHPLKKDGESLSTTYVLIDYLDSLKTISSKYSKIPDLKNMVKDKFKDVLNFLKGTNFEKTYYMDSFYNFEKNPEELTSCIYSLKEIVENLPYDSKILQKTNAISSNISNIPRNPNIDNLDNIEINNLKIINENNNSNKNNLKQNTKEEYINEL